MSNVSRLKRATTTLVERLHLKPRRKLDTTRGTFAHFLLSGPKLEDWMVDLINARSRDTGRDREL